MLNLFKRPYERDTLDAWAKVSDDIAKVAILSVPVILFGENLLWIKSINLTFLSAITYSALVIGRVIRKHKLNQEDMR